MIGSAVGGYVDPDVIKGPRLTDAQTQTSMEGAPRSIVYGTAVCAGNVIMTGPLVETKHRERTGKGGGPVQETYVYTRTYAVGVCEGPIAGISRIWRDDKLVYEARDPGDWPESVADIFSMGSDTARFASGIHIYLGNETQLPDATLESLPADNGGGMGNVPAFRGTAYVVFVNDDLTTRQGSIAQYRFEVNSAGSTAIVTDTFDVGGLTDNVTLSGFGGFAAYCEPDEKGLRFWTTANTVTVSGGEIDSGVYSDAMELTTGALTENAGNGPASPDIQFRAAHFDPGFLVSNTWMIAADTSTGRCQLHLNGSFVADLRPLAGTTLTWWGLEANCLPEFGGLIWFSSAAAAVFIGVRSDGSGCTVHNNIYKWPLTDGGGEIVPAQSITDDPVTAGSLFWLHLDSAGQLRSIALTEADLVSYDDDLMPSGTTALTMSLASFVAFGVDQGRLFLLRGSTAPYNLYIYDLATQTLLQTVSVAGSFGTYNTQIIFSQSSIFIRSGKYLKRIEYVSSCLAAVPPGWSALPDHPGFITDGAGNIKPLCSQDRPVVTGSSVILSDVVTDLCARVSVDADQIVVSQLTDNVRGFVVGQQMAASGAIRSLQQGYFFDFPEWGDYTDDGTKLRGIKRGGANVFTVTDADLVESDDDEDARAQAVEFPRKINLITSDVDAEYNPTKQTFERRTDNVKAVGEATVELPIATTRAEAAPIVDKMGKIAWTESEGRCKRSLPIEFGQYTPSDTGTMDGKRWRIEKNTASDGVNEWDLVRDRASAYTSVATPGNAIGPTTPVVTVRGPTRFVAMNLPQLRSQDNSTGMYVGVCGILPAWIGCDLYLSIDGGVTELAVARITSAATLGSLTTACTASSEPIKVRVSGELDSVTVAQIAARANAFAINDESEIGEVAQFQTATLDTDDRYDLTDITRGELGTTAGAHVAGSQFLLLNGAMLFLPIDVSLAGQTLIFRPVSIGTAAANNPTYSVRFIPQFTSVPSIDFYTTDAGTNYETDSGEFYQVTTA